MQNYLPSLKQMQYLVALHEHGHFGRAADACNVTQSTLSAGIRELETPAIAFFLILPAPLPALDAWEKMLPNVQRMAELLGGEIQDEGRNALGRQRIAHIRDELRAYDRQHEAPPLTKAPRW